MPTFSILHLLPFFLPGRPACSRPYPDGWVGFFREQALKLLIEYIGRGGIRD